MRVFGKTCAVLLMSAAALGCFAQQTFKAGNIKFKKFEFVDPPKYQNSGLSLASSISGSNMKWLMAHIEYDLVPSTGKMKKQKTGVTSIKDLEVELYISVPGKTGEDVSPRILITGKQKLWMVRNTGKRHNVLFVVPPQIFEQFAEKKTGGNGFVVKGMVVFKSGADYMGWEAFSTGREKRKDVAAEFKTLLGNRTTFKVDGGALPKEKSPWVWINSESFDLPASLFDGVK